MTGFMVIIYNAFIVAATGYYVFERGFSGWWFLLTICLMMSTSK